MNSIMTHSQSEKKEQKNEASSNHVHIAFTTFNFCSINKTKQKNQDTQKCKSCTVEYYAGFNRIQELLKEFFRFQNKNADMF